MITQRAFIIGVVGVCFYIIALVNQLPSYYSILTWLAITVLVSCAGVALLSLQGVGCKWRILRAKATATLMVETQDDAAEDRVLDVGDARQNNVFAARLRSLQNEARRAEAREAGIDGSGPMLEIEIENRGTLNKTGVLVDVRLRHLSRALALTRRFMIESLPSGTSLSSTLTLRGLPRGRYEIVEITVIGSDVLGLFRSRKRVYSNDKAQAAMRAQQIERANTTSNTSWRFYLALAVFGVSAILVGDFAIRFSRFGGVAAQFGGGLSALVGVSGLWTRARARAILSRFKPETEASDAAMQLVVGPATAFASSLPEASTADLAGHEASRVNALGRGDEMRGTRPYVAGDDLRTVHWKSTARLGQLVVREFHRPARSQSVVIWDGAITSSTRSVDDEGAGDTELCLSLAASICRGWVERGLSCTLLRLDSRPRVVKSVLGANGSALSPFVDALADADTLRETPLDKVIGAHLNALPASGDLFLVTSRDVSPQLPDDLAKVAGNLRRRGTRVCVVGVSRAKPAAAKRGLRGVFSRNQNAPFEIETRTDASGARVLALIRHRQTESQTETVGAELSALLNALLKGERAASRSTSKAASADSRTRVANGKDTNGNGGSVRSAVASVNIQM